MECAKCGESGFNRVIIDVQCGDILGGLCADCEASALFMPRGLDLEAGSTCVHCPQTSHIALPILECEISHKGDLLIEYDLSETTPHFCDDCAPIPLVDRDQVHDSIRDSAI